jgi:hypothetical protein
MANEQCAVSGMAHLHTDMKRFDVHVGLEVCERFAADTAASTVYEIVSEEKFRDGEGTTVNTETADATT